MKSNKSLGLLVGLLGIILLAGCTAPAPTDQTGTGFESWIWIIFLAAMFGIFYFLMIRPQQKRQKEQQRMMEGLQIGDRVVTIGGIHGQIERVDDNTVVLKIESGSVRMSKSSVAGKQELPAG